MSKFLKKVCLLIFAVVIVFSPIFSNQAEAVIFVPTLDSFNLGVNTITSQATALLQMKGYVLDGIMWAAKQAILNYITKQMLSWVGTGSNGNPMFVTNYANELNGIAQQTANNFFDSGALNNSCDYLKNPVQNALQAQYSNQNSLGSYNQGCTLNSATGGNNSAFANGDFSQGGWNAWFSMTQNPQNNPYGQYRLAEEQLNSQIAQKQGDFERDVQMNQGFKSVTKTDSSGNQIIITPGSVIRDQLNQVLSSPIRQLENVHNINEIVGVLATQLMNQALQNGIAYLNDQASGFVNKTLGGANLNNILNSGNLNNVNTGSLVNNYNGTSGGQSGHSYLDDLASENLSSNPLYISNDTVNNLLSQANASANNSQDASGNVLINKNTEPISLHTRKSPGGSGTGMEALDGITSGEQSASVSLDTTPYWEVDLGQARNLAYIKIDRVSKSGSGVVWDGQTSMGTFDVLLYNEDPWANRQAAPVKSVTSLTMFADNSDYSANADADAPKSKTVRLDAIGQYLVIKRQANSAGTNQRLMLAEVEIYQKPGGAQTTTQ